MNSADITVVSVWYSKGIKTSCRPTKIGLQNNAHYEMHIFYLVIV